ncbi:glutamate 5-kinase [Pelagicoccus sp. SDUM812002]|uniref:glutamate 5-kinase n=1 Tax=Pelagicoccus sp. SDUM812002 TaxID=3041266 RepID=UPI00281052D9|nr:glutamate 5-kinase [Pelagicoccus sp. SDUM812002]MDQ8187369.1 glutamate 5-kinase [Pelagicoccus sp. SDUM812002]
MKRVVIKLGTGILTHGIGKVDTVRINAICNQVAELRKRGIQTLIVSSGAVGMGMGALELQERPKTLAKQQACASIGQSRLIQCWQDGLQPHGLIAGQILLTHEDLRIRNRYVNAKATIEQLLAYGVVPVINENDSVSAFEIRFGNNDLLGAMVASLSNADQYQILSTAPGLIDMDGDGKIIPVVPRITPEVESLAKGTSSPTAVGGMVSKLEAAKLSTKSGCETFIADGSADNIILRIIDREIVGTRFEASPQPMGSKKRWLAYFQRASGSISIDDGASEAIIRRGRSLLAAGVTGFDGIFKSGDVVDILNEKGQAIARGEISFSSIEIEKIANKHFEELNALYPDRTRLEVVHRDALVLL